LDAQLTTKMRRILKVITQIYIPKLFTNDVISNHNNFSEELEIISNFLKHGHWDILRISNPFYDFIDIRFIKKTTIIERI
jgi:hypothetical protein